ncbi:MAG: metal-dependent hydrolase [Candidatus Acidiferrales bacterium]
MDTITHGIAGALIGKGYFSDRQGRVATFAATLGAVFPDCDVVAQMFSHDPLAIVKYHRGITHSFVGLPFFAAGLAWLTRVVARRLRIESPSWGMLTLIYAIGLASHILLDGLTSFGTRMWTPISQQRVAWDWLFIIDFTFTTILLAPQIAAWVCGDREKALRRGVWMWIVFSAGAAVVWELARTIGFPFRPWIIAISSGIFAILFLIPARGDWGYRIRRATWCRTGVYVTLAYVAACGMAHYSALRRVEIFASNNCVAITRIAALPMPPSFLAWGGAIRATNGVYQSRFDLRDANAPAFRFSGDSPPSEYTVRAMQLPEVRLYWTFARFPVIRTSNEDGLHVVDFLENRFITRRKNERPPFSYRVAFDDAGNVVEEGWEQNGEWLKRIEKIAPPHGSDPAARKRP